MSEVNRLTRQNRCARPGDDRITYDGLGSAVASLNRVKNLLSSAVSVEEDVSNLADGIPAPRALMWCQGIDRDVNVRSSRVLGAQPRLEPRALNLLHRANALCDTVRLI